MNDFDRFPPVTDSQRILGGNVWNVFNALGLGYLATFGSKGAYKVCLVPPNNSNYAKFWAEEKHLQILIDKGLVEQHEQKNAFPQAKTHYRLTEKGQELYNEISVKDNYQQIFLERVMPS